MRNEFLLRQTLHTWLAQTPALGRDLHELNEQVYSELFLTPRSDPWLGLLPDGVFTGLPGNGVIGR
jgi:hypothetical protein